MTERERERERERESEREREREDWTRSERERERERERDGCSRVVCLFSSPVALDDRLRPRLSHATFRQINSLRRSPFYTPRSEPRAALTGRS